jgi:1-deoxy-D-xylulose-5-phosphate synthase
MSDDTSETNLLNSLHKPGDLKLMKPHQLNQIANEMRKELIRQVNISGGHFAANLGTIELALATHYVFNTPTDSVIWDVGHQAYPHKMLTGRLDKIKTIKQKDGLAPFPKREESDYDAFGAGHSSTSISAGVGMSIAHELNAEAHNVISIIGDGGLTGGMALEALNHAGGCKTNLLVILNDNEMSISENVGALTQYFSRLLSGKLYQNVRQQSKRALSHLPRTVYSLFKRAERSFKSLFSPPGLFFEELGFDYLGPIDGHNINELISKMQQCKTIPGPKILHIKTVKGKGYAPAELDPIKYHAVKPGFLTPQSDPIKKPLPTYSQVFGQWACDVAEHDAHMAVITPAMREGSGLVEFHHRFPKQFFDVGIAEQHAVTLAAGMACKNIKPVVAIYSTFLQRAYDQLIHDVAIQNLDVTFAIDRAGLVGPDGPTHAGSFDLTYLRCIPNLIIMAPANENECYHMLNTAYQHPGPAAVRYPRGHGTGARIEASVQTLPIGKALYCRHGKNIALLCFGSVTAAAITAAESLDATVINMRFIKPLDKDTIISVAQTHSHLVTLEDNAIQGGAGSAVLECLHEHNIIKPVLQLGIPDQFIEHQSRESMLSQCCLTPEQIITKIHNHWNLTCGKKKNTQEHHAVES